METFTCGECGETVERRKAGPHKSVHVRQAKAKYIYPESDPKHPYLYGACRGCGQTSLMKVHGAGYCSLTCSQAGSRNSVWAGEDAGYLALHGRIYRILGKASERRCMCGERARDWANLTGDYADTYDYTAMCRRCHRRYDNARKSLEA